MNNADKLLSLLRNVKQTGPSRWIALCPAHEDKHPSLAVRELDDGRVLIHDFAGCSASEVLAAVGLTLEDLFPEHPAGHLGRKERRPFSSLDVLRLIAFEALVVLAAASSLAQGKPLSEIDRERLLKAVSRLQNALEVCDG